MTTIKFDENTLMSVLIAVKSRINQMKQFIEWNKKNGFESINEYYENEIEILSKWLDEVMG